MATWADGGNDYYTKDQLDAYNSQLASKQQQLALLQAQGQAAQQKYSNARPEDKDRAYQEWQGIVNGSQMYQLQNDVKNLSSQVSGTGVNPDGSPMQKRFDSITNPDGTLLDQYKLKDWQTINPDTSALDILKQDGLRSAGTDSVWAQLERQKQALNQQNAIDTATQTNANALTAAKSQLAQTGGMSGAARERVATNAMRNTGNSAASIARQGMTDNLNISSQDETNRLNGLKTIQDMLNTNTGYQFQNQQNAGKVDAVNLQNQLDQLNQKRAYNTNTYNQQMSAWGAGKTADAQRAASSGGGGGCFITTVVCDYLGLPDDNVFLNTFRKFRDEVMGGKGAEEVKEYYKIAPGIAETIKGKERTIKYILNGFLIPAFFEILKGEKDKAHQTYKDMVEYLVKFQEETCGN